MWAGLLGASRIKESRVIADYVARCTGRPAFLRTR